MNKWIFISISIVLAVVSVGVGVLYAQKTGKLKDTQPEIVTLEWNVSTLETELAELEAGISILETDLAAEIGSTKVYMMSELLFGKAVFPEIVTVPVGATVTWTNLSFEHHAAVSYPDIALPPLFYSGLIAPGESFSFTFTQPGIYYYNCWEEDCGLHPYRGGQVIVG
jgi:plastocyanin